MNTISHFIRLFLCSTYQTLANKLNCFSFSLKVWNLLFPDEKRGATLNLLMEWYEARTGWMKSYSSSWHIFQHFLLIPAVKYSPSPPPHNISILERVSLSDNKMYLFICSLFWCLKKKKRYLHRAFTYRDFQIMLMNRMLLFMVIETDCCWYPLALFVSWK